MPLATFYLPFLYTPGFLLFSGGRWVALNYLYSKSLDWFLYDKHLRHERVDEQFPEQFKWYTSYHWKLISVKCFQKYFVTYFAQVFTNIFWVVFLNE